MTRPAAEVNTSRGQQRACLDDYRAGAVSGGVPDAEAQGRRADSIPVAYCRRGHETPGHGGRVRRRHATGKLVVTM